MGKSQETWLKKEKEKKRQAKRNQKAKKKEERKANSGSGDLDSMMAYVDEFGNISSTPPDPTKKKEKIKAEDIVIGVPPKEELANDVERKGVVSFFNDSKGYGFIKDSDSGESFFVHANGLTEEVKENNLVTFELEPGQKGLQAVKVKIVR